MNKFLCFCFVILFYSCGSTQNTHNFIFLLQALMISGSNVAAIVATGTAINLHVSVVTGGGISGGRTHQRRSPHH